MNTVKLRKSGGASIVSIPQEIRRELGLKTGDQLEISIGKNRTIIMESKAPPMSLESLIADSPKANLVMTHEDREWEGMSSRGDEL